jgi:hypothetical protein
LKGLNFFMFSSCFFFFLWILNKSYLCVVLVTFCEILIEEGNINPLKGFAFWKCWWKTNPANLSMHGLKSTVH